MQVMVTFTELIKWIFVRLACFFGGGSLVFDIHENSAPFSAQKKNGDIPPPIQDIHDTILHHQPIHPIIVKYPIQSPIFTAAVTGHA